MKISRIFQYIIVLIVFDTNIFSFSFDGFFINFSNAKELHNNVFLIRIIYSIKLIINSICQIKLIFLFLNRKHTSIKFNLNKLWVKFLIFNYVLNILSFFFILKRTEFLNKCDLLCMLFFHDIFFDLFYLILSLYVLFFTNKNQYKKIQTIKILSYSVSIIFFIRWFIALPWRFMIHFSYF